MLTNVFKRRNRQYSTEENLGNDRSCGKHITVYLNRQIALDGNFPGKLDELEQGTAFLHENGIFDVT